MAIYLRHTHQLGAVIFERQDSIHEAEFNACLLVKVLEEMKVKDDIVIEVK